MPDVLGMAAMQPLAGLLRDITGSPAAPNFPLHRTEFAMLAPAGERRR